jgi:hypothetical protein
LLGLTYLGRTSQRWEQVVEKVLHLVADRKQKDVGGGGRVTRYNLQRHLPSNLLPPIKFPNLPKIAPPFGD